MHKRTLLLQDLHALWRINTGRGCCCRSILSCRLELGQVTGKLLAQSDLDTPKTTGDYWAVCSDKQPACCMATTHVEIGDVSHVSKLHNMQKF